MVLNIGVYLCIREAVNTVLLILTFHICLFLLLLLLLITTIIFELWWYLRAYPNSY